MSVLVVSSNTPVAPAPTDTDIAPAPAFTREPKTVVVPLAFAATLRKNDLSVPPVVSCDCALASVVVPLSTFNPGAK